MEDSLLEQLGFRSCGCCYKNEINRIQSEIDESNMDQIDLRGVGAAAADIRKWRKPEPYKGKGIKFEGEVIRRKEGKTGKK